MCNAEASGVYRFCYWVLMVHKQLIAESHQCSYGGSDSLCDHAAAGKGATNLVIFYLGIHSRMSRARLSVRLPVWHHKHTDRAKQTCQMEGGEKIELRQEVSCQTGQTVENKTGKK